MANGRANGICVCPSYTAFSDQVNILISSNVGANKFAPTNNKSVAAINTWQQQVKVYFECLVKEANTDNAIIAETANKEQAEYRKSVEAIGVAADVAKKKLEKQ